MTNGTGKPKHLQEFVMTAKGRDFELCSGGEEDEYLEVEVHSPTDSSEDSVEVKVSPICLRNKRKCAEPRKVQDAFTAPLKKRMCLKAKNEITDNPEPFRPWSAEQRIQSPTIQLDGSKKPKESNFIAPQLPTLLLQSQPSLYIHPPIQESKPYLPRSVSPDQPLPLVKKPNTALARERKPKTEEISIKNECEMSPTIYPSCDPASLRVPLHPHLGMLSTTEAERLIINSAEAFPNLHHLEQGKNEDCSSRKEQRNYKNMTRERRIEANARERTRVHTISAAFETLRKSVPAYSHIQKLSKLSVLRIACSYIMTLSTLVGDSPNSSSSLAECVDAVSKTIQKEGKIRKKKDDTE